MTKEQQIDMFLTLIDAEIKDVQQSIDSFSKWIAGHPDDKCVEEDCLNKASVRHHVLCHVRNVANMCFK